MPFSSKTATVMDTKHVFFYGKHYTESKSPLNNDDVSSSVEVREDIR